MSEYDFTASSQDRFIAYLVDEVRDAKTGVATETPINLTGATVTMRYKINSGALVTRTMTPMTQSGETLGKAYYDWQASELTAGTLKGEIEVQQSGVPHRQPGEFVLQIKAAMS